MAERPRRSGSDPAVSAGQEAGTGGEGAARANFPGRGVAGGEPGRAGSALLLPHAAAPWNPEENSSGLEAAASQGWAPGDTRGHDLKLAGARGQLHWGALPLTGEQRQSPVGSAARALATL